ncbi:MAG: outer membrane beta-barrel protein, partial [Rhodospirillaceae bacterium]
MNRFNQGLLAIAAVCAVSSPALSAEEFGPYIALGFGLHKPGNSTITAEIPAGTAPVENAVTFETGWGGHAAIGYRWPQNFRTEFEIGYRNATVDEVDGAPWLGRQSAVTFMGNVLYDVGIGTSFQPYVGGGAGLAMTK